MVSTPPAMRTTAAATSRPVFASSAGAALLPVEGGRGAAVVVVGAVVAGAVGVGGAVVAVAVGDGCVGVAVGVTAGRVRVIAVSAALQNVRPASAGST